RVVRYAPRANGVVLRLPGLPRRRLVTVGCPSPEDSPRGFLARLAARLRRGEEDRDVFLPARLGFTDRPDYLRCPAAHRRRTPRRRGREHDAPQQVWADERHLLGDEAADREAEQVDPLKIHGLEEDDGVVGHGLDGVRRRSGRGAYADVVESDDASLGG